MNIVLRFGKNGRVVKNGRVMIYLEQVIVKGKNCITFTSDLVNNETNTVEKEESELNNTTTNKKGLLWL